MSTMVPPRGVGAGRQMNAADVVLWMAETYGPLAPIPAQLAADGVRQAQEAVVDWWPAAGEPWTVDQVVRLCKEKKLPGRSPSKVYELIDAGVFGVKGAPGGPWQEPHGAGKGRLWIPAARVEEYRLTLGANGSPAFAGAVAVAGPAADSGREPIRDKVRRRQQLKIA